MFTRLTQMRCAIPARRLLCQSRPLMATSSFAPMQRRYFGININQPLGQQPTLQNGESMTADEAYVMNEAQLMYEYDYNNPKKAYEYFAELNKHQYYVTVVKEHDEFVKRIAKDKLRPSAEWITRLQSQYDYALDHLAVQAKQMDDGSEKDNSDYDLKSSLVNLMNSMIVLGAFYCFYVYFEPLAKSDLSGNQQEKMKFEIKKANEVEQRLDDVKGIKEIQVEVQELINMIKNSSDFTSKGAKLHKGVLLSGQPGTGKTLLARAIAGEAGVTFMYTTGSQFDEMFVGMGAKRVRELFKEARKQQPCIIFIDEVDSLMSKSRRFGTEHSSSRGTLNQLLSEIDGFERNDEIIVIGATNHEDDLDPAAVRPGRFDKKIHVPLPDVDGRREILDLYLNKIAKDDEVESKKLAKMTPGFSGAEIENLVNTAITQAVHEDKEMADISSFEYARDRLMMGIERKKLSMTEKDRLNTAIHEAGHATVCYFTEGASKLYKATVVARGGSLGATYMEPSDDLSTTKLKVLAQIDTAMGGHVAEKLFIGNSKVTTGCSGDFQGATSYAYQAVLRFGMFGEDVGYMSSELKDLSEEAKAKVDQKVKQLLEESEQRVERLLLQKDKEMRILSKNLYWYDYLDAKEMDIIFKGGQISGKEKVRQYTFETDIEERNLEENVKVLVLPVEQPQRTVEISKPDSKDEKADEKTPKKPGSDDGSDGGPGGERLIPESILPGRDENSAPQ